MKLRVNYSDELRHLMRHAGELPKLNRDGPLSRAELVSYERAAKLLTNVGLTAEFNYRFPDYPDIVAEPLVRQFDDLAPTLPKLGHFIRFWQRKLIGPLFEVNVDGCELVKAREIRALDEGKIFYLQ